jgi:hypothetical protein
MKKALSADLDISFDAFDELKEGAWECELCGEDGSGKASAYSHLRSDAHEKKLRELSPRVSVALLLGMCSQRHSKTKEFDPDQKTRSQDDLDGACGQRLGSIRKKIRSIKNF